MAESVIPDSSARIVRGLYPDQVPDSVQKNMEQGNENTWKPEKNADLQHVLPSKNVSTIGHYKIDKSLSVTDLGIMGKVEYILQNQIILDLIKKAQEGVELQIDPNTPKGKLLHRVVQAAQTGDPEQAAQEIIKALSEYDPHISASEWLRKREKIRPPERPAVIPTPHPVSSVTLS